MVSATHDANRARHWVCALQLAERRHQLGLTQQDVVDRLSALGITASNRTLSAMEHGQGIDVGRLPELAIALDCTVTYLLGLTVQPERWEPDVGTAPVPTPDRSQSARTEDASLSGAWFHGVWHPDGGHQHELIPNSRPGLRRFTEGTRDPQDSRKRRRMHSA